MSPEKVSPEELAEQLVADPDSDDEELDAADYVAAIMSEIMETGVPVRAIAHEKDPMVRPLIQRIQRQNEILADISLSVRAIAVKMGALAPSLLAVRDADLSKK